MTDGSDESLRGRAWEGVLAAIREGGYLPGDRLPPERELAERLGVSRATLRLALHDLERAGQVVRRPGRGGGTFVAAPKVERDLAHFAGLAEYIRRQGMVAGTRVIAVALTVPEPPVAEALRLDRDEPVVAVTRVRLAGGEPIALERSRFPARRFPDLAEQALGGSLYDLLRDKYGESPERAVERIEPVAADAETAGLLDVAPGTPLLAVQRVAYNAAGEPIEHADDLFRGDRTRVVVWTSPEER
ncbi:GntR family transcriptional regulator [Actinomadura miaoliensis]|uniref:GntR family transcriptional regulator n=1 Tax=Actinomadura miaoliensis TaxID=430685 RepID=A0ABP7W454_9ACTN